MSVSKIGCHWNFPTQNFLAQVPHENFLSKWILKKVDSEKKRWFSVKQNCDVTIPINLKELKISRGPIRYELSHTYGVKVSFKNLKSQWHRPWKTSWWGEKNQKHINIEMSR